MYSVLTLYLLNSFLMIQLHLAGSKPTDSAIVLKMRSFIITVPVVIFF